MGHEFRPEYRQLSRLRELFPDKPIAAFYRSATQRVRHDIIEQLRLREPTSTIASFRGQPELPVHESNSRTQEEMLLRRCGESAKGNVIVYAPTVARVAKRSICLRKMELRRSGTTPDGRQGAAGKSGKMDERRSSRASGTLAFAWAQQGCSFAL